MFRDALHRLHRKAFLILLLVMMVLPLAAQDLPEAFWPERLPVTESRSLSMTTGANATVTGLFSEAGAPVRVYGGLTQAGFTATQADRQALLSVIDRHEELFGVRSADLEVLHEGPVNGKAYLTARQLVDGRPVMGSRVLLRVAENGRVGLWGADVQRNAEVNWQAAYTALDATEQLAAFAGVEKHTVLETREVWAWLEGELVPAWFVRLEGESPIQRPVGMVQAESGAILGFYNDAYEVDINGTVEGPMWPHQIQDDPVWTEFPDMRVYIGNNAQTTNAAGYFVFEGLNQGGTYTLGYELRGPWVNVNYEDGEDARHESEVVAPGDAGLTWQYPLDGREDEFNVFYFTTFIHDWYKELDPDFTAMDYPVNATVAFQTNWENAMWGGDQMFFGTGGNTLYNLAMFSDVIIHEYTHGVTGNIYPQGTLPYSGQSGALNEAWSDYIPCSIHDYSTMAPGVYVGNPGTPMRNLDNTRRYPENWVGEVHGDGLIPGGAMWDTREMLGAEVSDDLFHFARYGLAADFVGYLVEVLVQDDDDGDLSNGTPHSDEIYTGFGMHGIGPSEEPNLQVRSFTILEEDSDGHLMPGEWVELEMFIENDVMLYPPPATDVTVSVEGDEFTLFETNDVIVGEVPAGEMVALPEAIRFQVAEDGFDPHYVTLRITLTANDGAYETTAYRRVVLGDPNILLVNDFGQPDYRHYVDRYIRAMYNAADVWDTDNGTPGIALLSEHDIVIWVTGDARNPLSQADVDVMTEYVQHGGGLILSGQHIGPQLAGYTDFSALLGVAESVDSLHALGIVGVTGEPLSEGNVSAIFGAGGANNQTAPSGIIAANDARVLYTYSGSETVAAVWNDTGEEGAVVYMGFGLEAVSGVSTSTPGQEILYPILNAMGYEWDVEDDPSESEPVAQPLEYSLQAPYPNPFNPEATVAFTLPRAGQVKLAVYNVMGREVLRVVDGIRTSGRHQVRLNLDGFATGMYLVRFDTPRGSFVQKALLVK